MLDASVRPYLPATKKHKRIQSTDPRKPPKQFSSIPSLCLPLSIQACPALRAPETLPLATPVRGTPEEETAGSNAKFPEEKAPEDKDKVGRARQ
jgi:hypothetical protein